MFAINALVVGEATRRVDYDWGFFIALLTNTVIAGTIVVLQALWSGGLGVWQPEALLLFFVAGVFATYIGRLLYFLTVVGMGPSRATAFQITQPLFASVLALVFLGERLGIGQVALMLLALAGLFLVNRSRAAVAPLQRRRGMVTRRRILLAALGSGMAYAAANVLRSAAINDWNQPVLGALLGALAGLVCYLLFHVPVKELAARLRSTDPAGMRLFMASGVLSILAQTASIASLRYLPVAIANIFAVSTPILVVPLSVLLLHNRESVTPLAALGVLVTWVAVVGLVVV